MIIDSHCHFNSLSSDIIEEIFSSVSSGLVFLDSSTDFKSTQASLSISKQYPFIYTSAGFHPFWGHEYSDDLVDKYDALINGNDKVVAIGEIGLDYKAQIPLDKQEVIFRNFIKLAQKKDLPIVIHNRLSGYRILDILDDCYPDYEKIVFHCFSYSKEFLEKILSKKGMISFSLNILRKKQDIMLSLKECPLNNMLLETDSPYMRIAGRPSTPLDIKSVYDFAAEVKEVDKNELEKQAYANAKRMFNLK
jgi:TatD DNase family protein